MSTQIFRVKDTTFADIISIGAFTILEGFLNVLKDEIEKGNTVIVEKYQSISDETYQREIKTLAELEEFKKVYL